MKVNHKVIYSNQKKLFGNEEIIGYGTSEFCVKIIKRKKAVDVIKKNHYSKKVTPNGYLNIGIFIDNCMVGVLMFGHLFNASYHSKIVSGGNSCNAMELNRMWINDNAPKNTASKAISYSIKLIKKKYSNIKWIQSFADERCKRFGVVYQACSFNYYGEHNTVFYELDGVVYHNIEVNRKDRKGNLKKKYFDDNRHKLKKMVLRQFRYIKFLDKRFEKNCLLKQQSYPKHYL